MSIFAWFKRLVDVVITAGGWVGTAALVLLLALIVANVVGRYFWQPLLGTVDLTEASLVVITGMLLAYTQARRGHINVDFITERLPGQVQRVLSLIVIVLVFCFTVILAWQSWKFGLDNLAIRDFSSTPPYVPFYPAKLLLAIGVSLLGLQLIVDVWRSIKNLSAGKSESGAAA